MDQEKSSYHCRPRSKESAKKWPEMEVYENLLPMTHSLPPFLTHTPMPSEFPQMMLPAKDKFVKI